jgi:hypothetical protein
MKASAREFPCPEDAIKHLEEAKAKTLGWIRRLGSSGLLTEKPLWPWTGSYALSQGLYHLRHLQHHLAELAVELRRRGLPCVALRSREQPRLTIRFAIRDSRLSHSKERGCFALTGSANHGTRLRPDNSGRVALLEPVRAFGVSATFA